MPSPPKSGYSRVAKGKTGFFAALPVLTDFADFSDGKFYRAAPSDWRVVVTDIVGSTKAVDQGRYKEVNMVAAASIVAVLNLTEGIDIPFVFGGDGATLLVPPETAQRVALALSALSKLVVDQFGLTLRVGMISVGDLSREGGAVRVARFRLSPGNHAALFMGGGVELAQELVKNPATTDRYSVADAAENAAGKIVPDLSGLSCRWEPLHARHGVMLAILVEARGPVTADGTAAYRSVMDRIVAVLGGDPDAGNPVAEQTLRFRWPPRGLALEEWSMTAGDRSRPMRLRLLTESFIQWIANRFNLRAGAYDARPYRNEIRLNSDYRRFDDTLRLVIDCTEPQASEIEALLQEEASEKRIHFGVHRSDSALMTCLLFSLEQSEHLHFIDGNYGGFTLAAQRLKAQKAQRMGRN